MIVLECDSRVYHTRIQAIQFFELREHVFLNGIRQRYVMRGEDQLHTNKMQSTTLIFNRQIPHRNFAMDERGEIRVGGAAERLSASTAFSCRILEPAANIE